MHSDYNSYLLDHPRIRGEHSPPGAREAHVEGIIPAYAGSTDGTHRRDGQRDGSSPHTREAPRRAATSAPTTADHPRIRGKHQDIGHPGRRPGGIIPAYAGSTVPSGMKITALGGSSPHTRGARAPAPTACTLGGDHPRIRGEHPGELHLAVRADGIIPAYAGSTTSSPSRLSTSRGSSPHTRGALPSASRHRARRRDHPRIRGEHRLRVGLRPGAIGIIPAYAGSTWCDSSPTWPSRGSSPHTRGALSRTRRCPARRPDHPRIRGEHPCGQRALAREQRIIPAYAGSTETMATAVSRSPGSSPHTRGALIGSPPSPWTAWDHPRIRGEHGRAAGALRLGDGIIPAYAGSTQAPHRYLEVPGGSSPHTRGAPPTSRRRTRPRRDHPRIRGEHGV